MSLQPRSQRAFTAAPHRSSRSARAFVQASRGDARQRRARPRPRRADNPALEQRRMTVRTTAVARAARDRPAVPARRAHRSSHASRRSSSSSTRRSSPARRREGASLGARRPRHRRINRRRSRRRDLERRCIRRAIGRLHRRLCVALVHGRARLLRRAQRVVGARRAHRDGGVRRVAERRREPARRERRMASDRCCDGGAFLCGEAFTLAECVAAPWVERMSAMLPLWRNIDFTALCERHERSLPTKVAAWSDAVLERPPVQSRRARVRRRSRSARAARRYYVEDVSPVGGRGRRAVTEHGSRGRRCDMTAPPEPARAARGRRRLRRASVALETTLPADEDLATGGSRPTAPSTSSADDESVYAA